MTLEEAIKHCHEKAEELKSTAKLGRGNPNPYAPLPEECLKCAKEHEQLADWLEELKARREADQTKWIPIKTRPLPEPYRTGGEQ